MTPYKGIIQIICKKKKGCLKNLKVTDVQPGCMDCPEAVTRILDLDGKVIYEYPSTSLRALSVSKGRSPVIKTGVRKAHSKKSS